MPETVVEVANKTFVPSEIKIPAGNKWMNGASSVFYAALGFSVFLITFLDTPVDYESFVEKVESVVRFWCIVGYCYVGLWFYGKSLNSVEQESLKA